jgi:DNA-binding transcriptional MerR regulator
MKIEELADQVARVLAQYGLEDQPDGRVSDVPDPRTVRYYTTLGLLDRPKIVDREASYSRRHVLQLAAIKALQTTSLSLAQIQERLYGRSDAELEAVVEAVGKERPRPSVLKSVTWREITLEPGLKLWVEEGWSPRADPAALVDRLRAALSALSKGA